MFTQKYRPLNLSEVVGSSYAVKILRSIKKNPDKSPRSLIFSGNPGIGKTSCSRILPALLNCKKVKKTSCCDQMCAECPCQNKNAIYEEFNCSQFGNVKFMRDIESSVLCSFSEEGMYRVIAFDEAHLASQEAQSALLKVIEESSKDIFFVFCTTEPSQIIPTIISRSIEIDFTGATTEETVTYLKNVAKKESLLFSEELYQRIAYKVYGDLRNALNRLQEASIVGEKEFLDRYVSLDSEIEELFSLCVAMSFNVDEYLGKVESILSNPVQYIRDDFERFVVKKSEELFVKKIRCSGRVSLLISDWLKVQQSLKTRGDWNVFFNSMQRYSERRT